MSNVQVFFSQGALPMIHHDALENWDTKRNQSHCSAFQNAKKDSGGEAISLAKGTKPQEALVSTLKLWGFPVGCPLDQLPSRNLRWQLKIHEKSP